MALNIKKIKQALITPDFFKLELTNDLFSTIVNPDSLDVLLKAAIDKDDKTYLQLQKKYSIEIKTESQLTEPTEEQKEAADSLKRYASVVAEQRNESVSDIEKKIKQFFSLDGITYNDIDLEMLPYVQPIIDKISRINNQDKNNQLVVTEILKNRVVDSNLKPLLPDWSLEHTINLGSNFINTVMIDFVFPERQGWQTTEADSDDELGKSGNE